MGGGRFADRSRGYYGHMAQVTESSVDPGHVVESSWSSAHYHNQSEASEAWTSHCETGSQGRDCWTPSQYGHQRDYQECRNGHDRHELQNEGWEQWQGVGHRDRSASAEDIEAWGAADASFARAALE